MTVNFDSTLLVVDAQRGFVNEHTQPALNRVVSLCGAWRGPIIATRFVNSPTSPIWRIGWEEFQVSSDTDLLPEIERMATHILVKDYYAIPAVNAVNTDEVTIVGVDTDACVLASAFSLFDSGHTVKIWVPGCASTAGSKIHEAALKIMERQFGSNCLIWE